MKALILTHPIGTNYGGILQCYALQTVLKKRGYEVEVINLKHHTPFYKKYLKRILTSLIGSKCVSAKYRKMYDFVSKNIVLTNIFYSGEKIKQYIEKNDFDVVFVGSDQVWKKEFALKYDYCYFLDFVPNNVKKVAYAVSFGTNIWKYDKFQTLKIKEYISSYQGFSVREKDAVEMCKENLKITPFHVLDPTLLLNTSDYISLLSSRPTNKKYIFVYWLWNKEKILKAVSEIQRQTNYEIIELSMLEGTDFMSVEDWITHIRYAEIVITDSFHGCVFSLLFNKVVNYVYSDHIFDNRRASLFSMFDIDSKKMFTDKEEEYKKINALLEKYRTLSNSFINDVLS